MTRPPTDDRATQKLPVTGEVGSEGGSYADATMQVATFAGEAGTLKGASEPLEDSHGYAIAQESPGVEGGVSDAASGMYRYPTEPPPASTLRSLAGLNWRAGAIGAVAGAAGAAIAMALRRRRRS